MGLEPALDPESIQGWDLLRGRFGAVIQGLEHQGLNQGIAHRVLVGRSDVGFGDVFPNLVGEVGTKRLHRWEVDAAVLAVDGSSLDRGVVHVIEHPILVGHAIDVNAIHPQDLNQQAAVERLPRDVVEVHPRVGVVVPNVQTELLIAHPKRPHRIDVFHHGTPKRGLVSVVEFHLGDGRLQHLQHQSSRRRISVLGQRTHLICLPVQGVFVGDRKNLRVVQRLPQRDKTEPAVVCELRRTESTGIPHALIVNTLFEVASKCR